MMTAEFARTLVNEMIGLDMAAHDPANPQELEAQKLFLLVATVLRDRGIVERMIAGLAAVDAARRMTVPSTEAMQIN